MSQITQCGAIALGVVGAIWVFVLVVRFTAFGKRIREATFTVPSYRPHLGLQAAIGDDLRALLVGWIPGTTINPFLPNPFKEFFTKRNWTPKLLFTQVVYCCSVAVVLYQLWPSSEHEIPYIELTFYAVFSVFTVLQIASLIFVPGPKRILLVVDDLDRCESKTMLDVIESVMLLLNDPQIKSRMQIAMLLEEDALRASLVKKYSHVSCGSTIADSAREERIYRENLEKIFLAYLRLPPLSSDEISEVLLKFVKRASIPLDETKARNSARITSSGIALFPKQMPKLPPKAHDGVVEGKVMEFSMQIEEKVETHRQLSDEEARVLVKALKHLSNAPDSSIRWGPRSIRSLIAKFLLARAISHRLRIHLSSRVSADQLIHAILPESQRNPVAAQIEKEVEIIASQVR